VGIYCGKRKKVNKNSKKRAMKNKELSINNIAHSSLFIAHCASRRGVGGSRTLVQTGSKNAFYMLSLRLIVGS